MAQDPEVTVKTITAYAKAGESATYQEDWTSAIQAAFTEAGLTLTGDNLFARWDVKKNDALETLNQWNSNVTITAYGNNHFTMSSDNTKYFFYKGFDWQSNPLDLGFKPNITFGNAAYQLGCVLECYVSNNGRKTNSDPNPNTYQVLYRLIFNSDGLEPIEDSFLGSAKSGANSSGTNLFAAEGSPKDIDFSSVGLSSVKYARVYLADENGSPYTDQSPLAVSYNGTPASAAGSDIRNGVYIYDGGNNLTLSDISATLTPDSGTPYFKYKVVCLLSTKS